MVLSDLASYEPIVKPALNISYRGLDVFATGAPSSGAVTLSILKTMEQYPLGPEVLLRKKPDVLSYHRFDEAMRFGYAARAELGDPEYVPGVTTIESAILNDESAIDRRSRIRDDTTQPVRNYSLSGDGSVHFASGNHGTSHVVAMDASGMVITLTTTINLLFGSHVIDSSTGIILNNEMDDFSLPNRSNSFGFPPAPANFIRPGKRPLSSITPIIATRKDKVGREKVVFATGAAGGSRIVSATTQVAWHLIEHDMNLDQALAEPRLHDQLLPNMTTFEYNFNNETVVGMKERGHNIRWVREGYSAVQAIGLDVEGNMVAASEPRQVNSGGIVV